MICPSLQGARLPSVGESFLFPFLPLPDCPCPPKSPDLLPVVGLGLSPRFSWQSLQPSCLLAHFLRGCHASASFHWWALQPASSCARPPARFQNQNSARSHSRTARIRSLTRSHSHTAASSSYHPSHESLSQPLLQHVRPFPSHCLPSSSQPPSGTPYQPLCEPSFQPPPPDLPRHCHISAS